MKTKEPARALHPRWPPWLLAAVYFAVDTSALSLAAWLGSIPLAAAYFHLFTPISIPTNILVVPITALALMSSIGSLLTGAWFPGLSILFNQASWFYMDCIIAVSRWAAQWAPGAWNVTTPAPTTFVLYYLVLFTVLTGWIFRSKFKWAVLAMMVGLCACSLMQRLIENRFARLYFLPLHGGSAVFADNTGPEGSFLFDCGNTTSTETLVKPFLRAHGVNALEALALTTGHISDCGGASVVLTNFSVKNIWLNPVRDRSAAYRELVDAIKTNNRWGTLHDGDHAGGWMVLHPEASTPLPTADDNALIFRREIKGHSILLASSLGRAGQESLMARHPGMRAEIVVASLPASDEPLCEPFLEQIQPRLIIIIDSDRPATHRASPKLRQRLARHEIPIVYCHETGALKLSFADNSWEMRDASGQLIR